MSLSPSPSAEQGLGVQHQQQLLQLHADAESFVSSSVSPSGRSAGGKGVTMGKKGKSKK
jgi:hypothetical protein